MQKFTKSNYGISAVTVTIDLNDAIAITMLLNKVEEYEKRVDEYNKWAQSPDHIDPETGEFIPEPEDPMEFIEKAKNILRQLTFVNIGESNVFDEDWTKNKKDGKSSNDD